MKESKQFQGSKKKGRRKAYFEREDKRAMKIAKEKRLQEAIARGDIPTAARLMGDD